jgi:hypothetical protein
LQVVADENPRRSAMTTQDPKNRNPDGWASVFDRLATAHAARGQSTLAEGARRAAEKVRTLRAIEKGTR